MNPTTPTSNTGYDPNWRHFSPSDVVFAQNPFDHDVSWDVFDEERRRQVRYTIGANERGELTGGLVHTLGVKAIVDEMIQQDGKKLLIWDPKVRAEYEDKVILKVKAAASNQAIVSEEGVLEVKLGSKSPSTEKTAEAPAKANEVEFPDAQPDVVAATRRLPATDTVEA